MRYICTNLLALCLVVSLLLAMASCVATGDGNYRPATAEEAAVMVETATATVAPMAGPYEPFVLLGSNLLTLIITRWETARQKDKARAKEDAAWDEAHKLPPPSEVSEDEAPA